MFAGESMVREVQVLFWVKDLPEEADEEFECWRRGGSLAFIDDELACVEEMEEFMDEEW